MVELPLLCHYCSDDQCYHRTMLVVPTFLSDLLRKTQLRPFIIWKVEYSSFYGVQFCPKILV